MSDWRTSEKADELREFINKEFKVKKPTLGGLEREVIIDFVAKEIHEALAEDRQFILNVLDGIDIADKQMGVTGGTKAIRHALKSRVI